MTTTYLHSDGELETLLPLAVHYSAAVAAVRACRDIDELADWDRKAHALAVYAFQSEDHELENLAVDIRLRARRRTGELLLELERVSPETRAKLGGEAKSALLRVETKQLEPFRSPYATALLEHHISRPAASAYQKLALVPVADFEKVLASPGRKTMRIFDPVVVPKKKKDRPVHTFDRWKAAAWITNIAGRLWEIPTGAELAQLFDKPLPDFRTAVHRLRVFFDALDDAFSEGHEDEK